MLQRRAYSIPIANSHILLGLYEGRYYEECLRFFYGLNSLDPSFQLIKSPTAVFSVLKAAYQLHRYAEVLKLYEYILQHKITPNRSVVFIIAEVRIWSFMNDRSMRKVIFGEVNMNDR